MRIYTRYKPVSRARRLYGALRLTFALAGLGLIAYVVYRHAEPAPPAPRGSTPFPTHTAPHPTPPRPTNSTTSRSPAPSTTAPPLTVAPPTAAPPTAAPPTVAPPTVAPPTVAPPTVAPPTVAPPTAAPPTVAPPTAAPPTAPPASTAYPRPVESLLDAQIALARQGISSGSIDGVSGYQTRAALRAFQGREGLPQSGALDPRTRARLLLDAPAFTNAIVTSNDLSRLRPVPPTWLGKSQQPRLDYATLLELIAERHRAHPSLVRRLNPAVEWTNVMAGQSLVVPSVPTPVLPARLAFLRIRLQDRILAGYDLRTNLLLQFPCSIAARLEKRPLGRLEVVVIALDPAYTFNPAVFPESAEGRRLGRKLTIPPGPNNPVGVAWIGLSRPGYGIHGTPRPEDVGRTESHGCFRLANWDAAFLVQLVWRGLPVYVQH